MNAIHVEHNVSQDKLDEMKITDWPVWEKDVSEFPWSYGEKETCYILEGKAEVISDGSDEAVSFGKGDLVIFPQRLSCVWKIIEPVKKHYKFGE